MDMKGKIAIVTGAYGGIGQAVAQRLAGRGASVVCADLKGAEETVKGIKTQGGNAVSKKLDVSIPADWKKMMSEVNKEFGGVDYLVAVAGIVNRISADTILDLTEEAWDTVLNVDAKGVWLGMQAVIPSMLERGSGRIVNISSLAASKGLQGLASYSAAKGAVEALTRQAAVEYGRQGILINCVAPGTIETTINKATLETEEGAKNSSGTTAIGRWGQPDEIGSIIEYLLQDGSFVAGQVFHVDGGWSITGGVEYGDSREM
ncbi:MAG: SDR family oxidoreductase [Sphaerochaeta sp.]|jgi:NAD(P)-dependent dehydrogenase (short-subunit alcohol dehydrogenase family)